MNEEYKRNTSFDEKRAAEALAANPNIRYLDMPVKLGQLAALRQAINGVIAHYRGVDIKEFKDERTLRLYIVNNIIGRRVNSFNDLTIGDWELFKKRAFPRLDNPMATKEEQWEIGMGMGLFIIECTRDWDKGDVMQAYMPARVIEIDTSTVELYNPDGHDDPDRKDGEYLRAKMETSGIAFRQMVEGVFPDELDKVRLNAGRKELGLKPYEESYDGD